MRLFGSVSDGVPTRDSDVDVTVLLLGGSTLHDATLARLAAETLSQHPQFTNFRIPKNVKVNIVKCVHAPSGLPIDISFGRLINVRSSSVISYFMKDRRAFQLMMLFKRWAKLHSNYNLYPLVIFYLQQENILPPVSLLQKHAKQHFVGEWNTGFETVEFQSENTKSLYELLGGFFEYYTKFEYEKYVISMFAGYPVEKAWFAKLELPEEFALYKWNIRQNVSTPLDLRHKFTLHRFFDLNVREGEILLEPFAYSAMVFRLYNSTEFFNVLFNNAMYCVNDPFGSVLFNRNELKVNGKSK